MANIKRTKEEREKLVELFKKNPNRSMKELAEKVGVPLYFSNKVITNYLDNKMKDI